eukprot:11197652-Heterocapsa_arctica.AAC.1
MPHRIPREVPIGPRRCPPNWKSILIAVTKATAIGPGATLRAQWGAVSAAYKTVADCMEKELIGTTDATLEKLVLEQCPPSWSRSP